MAADDTVPVPEGEPEPDAEVDDGFADDAVDDVLAEAEALLVGDLDELRRERDELLDL